MPENPYEPPKGMEEEFVAKPFPWSAVQTFLITAVLPFLVFALFILGTIWGHSVKIP